jgi:hypothetical protein
MIAVLIFPRTAIQLCPRAIVEPKYILEIQSAYCQTLALGDSRAENVDDTVSRLP